MNIMASCVSVSILGLKGCRSGDSSALEGQIQAAMPSVEYANLLSRAVHSALHDL
jgi:hypothetical protein